MPQPAEKPETAPVQETGTFGKLAVQLGFLTKAQLDEALKTQAAASTAGLPQRLGEILIKKGYLTTEQCQKILKSQKVSRKQIGDFELLSKLGEGGMGSVFKARQMSMDRVIALKVLSPKMAKNREFRERFQREARAVAKLNHPHIVSGIDVGVADGYCYFAMEFVDGDSLGQYMHRKGGKLAEKEALEFIRQMALALDHAHENNLLHRDVKPDNILLDQRCATAKLVDLGLVRSAEEGDDAGLTQAGQAVGTPFYISPEQARGRRDLSAATDLYSLGATLYHLLTGQVPYDGATAAVIMTRHLTDPVPSPRSVNPGVSPSADKIVMRLMAKDPEDRYASAMDLAEDIERVLAGESLAKPAAGIKGASKHTRPRPVVEREREDDDDDSEVRGSSAPARRGYRKARRQRDVMGPVIAGGLVLILAAGLWVMKPWEKKNNQPAQKTPSPASKASAPPAIAPAVVDPPPPAVPAVLETLGDGRKRFAADFESKTDAFDVDPLICKPGLFVMPPVRDKSGNHTLRLAAIRQPYRSVVAQKESGVMARLLLPPDLVLSPRATLSFSVHFLQTDDPNPEIIVYWDHQKEGAPRAMAGFQFKNAAFRTSWGKVHAVLGKAPLRVASREAPGSPQYISFFAGNPEDKTDVYIDDIELVDGGPEPEPAPKEAPVTPRPKRKKPDPEPDDKEPPVAPPPPKKSSAPDPANPADALRQAL